MGPLEGIKIIDISTIVSGPLAASMLGDQGAEVIKIEPPYKGENARVMGPIKEGSGALFATVNRSKRSLAMDLKKAESKKIIYKLIESADIIIDNFRPGALDRLGLDFNSIKNFNPRIIQMSITGYGETGPYSKRRVYDPLIQATAGVCDAQSIDGQPKYMKTLMCDKITSLTAAQAMTAALFKREKTNSGQRVTLSMLDTALYFMWSDSMYNYSWHGDDWAPIPNIADFYEPVKTKDGHIALVAINDSEFSGVLKAIGREDLLEDERFSTTENRLMNVVEMQEILLNAYSEFTSDELVERMEENDVPAAKINRREDIFSDPQVINNSSIINTKNNGEKIIKGPKPPANFLDDECDEPKFMPALGQHSSEILKEYGFSNDEINSLIEKKIIQGEKFD
tara:strand:+ start:10361 stop:11551 length:1191 start_codon:yes stop_codon:yes gene_type:complete